MTRLLQIIVSIILLHACSINAKNMAATSNMGNMDTATFGGGCFWCTEAVFQQVNGVLSVTSGYSGGSIKNPSYREVCSGRTGHAEVIRIVYNPDQVSFKELLDVFFKTHDPTTPDRQGNDVGSQYRSVVFYHNEQQRETALQYISELNLKGVFIQPLVTEISPIRNFYPAGEYHQDYYERNKSQPYCVYVINPKLKKFQDEFSDKFKK